MKNIWEFAGDLPEVTVTKKTGEKLEGEIIHVADSEETEFEEDSISIITDDGRILIIMESEIADIERK